MTDFQLYSPDYLKRLCVRGGRLEPLDDDQRLFLASWGATGRIWKGDGGYHENICTTEAVDTCYIDAGVAPVRTAHDDYSLEGQIGTLRAAKVEDNQLTLIGQIGYSPKAEWLWRNLRAGIVYGCSLGHQVVESQRIDVPKFAVTVTRATRWRPLELTILQALGGCDDQAKVSCAQDLPGLLRQYLDEAALADRETCKALGELIGDLLPSVYAKRLRSASKDMARTIAERLELGQMDVGRAFGDGGGQDNRHTIERALAERVERFIKTLE